MSFDVQQGEFVALVGPSGSGKTSMLAMLAGLLTPSGGQVARYVDKFIQMKDGKISRIIEDRAKIDALAERVD